jgi:hypothetical protein
MKKVTISKIVFDNLVYPAVALSIHGEDLGELRLCDKVLTKLEAKAKVLPPEKLAKSEPGDLPPPKMNPLYGLKKEKDTFDFEDHEAEYIVGKLTSLLPRIHGRILRPLLPIIAELEKEEVEGDEKATKS